MSTFTKGRAVLQGLVLYLHTGQSSTSWMFLPPGAQIQHTRISNIFHYTLALKGGESVIYRGGSQPQHYGHFSVDNSLLEWRWEYAL